MSAPGIEDYLRRLREHLAWRSDADDLVDEYADHLWTAYEVGLTRGLPAAESERQALAALGPVDVVRDSLPGRETDRQAFPTLTTRLAGAAYGAAGLGWIVVGVALFGAYWRPGALWGHLSAALFPVLPVLVLLTGLGLAGLHLRLGRPVRPCSIVALVAAAGAVLVSIAQVDAMPFWSGLLAVAGGATVVALPTPPWWSRSALRTPWVGRASLALWWVLTTPAQLVLQLAADRNLVVIAAGWTVGFIGLGVAQTLIGRALWTERAADRSPSTVSA